MKALVLCGGYPQLALINDLKDRGIETVLADKDETQAFYLSIMDLLNDIEQKEKI